MTKDSSRSLVKQALRSHAPDLSSDGLEVLSNMYVSDYLYGTANTDPILIEKPVRIPIKEGAELHRIIREHSVQRSLEIGFAYGFSTVWMLDGHSAQTNASHTALDPFEKTDWQGVGLYQVNKLGAKAHFDWIEDYVIHALPRFIANGEQFDFIFIDGNHRFDDIIVDFYLSDMILSTGGIIAFDDMWMKSIQAAVRFITNNRKYELIHQPVQNLAVLRKIGDDDRPWNHYRSFRTAERFHEIAARLGSKRNRKKLFELVSPRSR